MFIFFFFFNDTATTEIYTLSLHDALPISKAGDRAHHLDHLDLLAARLGEDDVERRLLLRRRGTVAAGSGRAWSRSEEHTSELQSRQYLVCRLLLEKKKINNKT